ncbi:Mu-like prophage protein gp36 [Mizugakiibacter sediminis]|uniref:Mu-like prophage protein gp36 n=1 Tax=Mizugakiibacter sediminis TaxID=1475481 RepID=A0A0K8QN30_9GAMM|nr:phage protein Gp36 family protein [Mizugakiibacter sediminis]GAP66268.1 Mu-like prophage protein gp36 [Mizugakiibacter sediminis]
MSLTLPSASDLLAHYAVGEIAEVATPKDYPAVEPALLRAAAAGDPLDAWTPEQQAAAQAALARIAVAIERAGSEAGYYLRFRADTAAPPAWLADDLAELARYHLYDTAGAKDSTVRLRYQDVIARLRTLAEEDAKAGAGVGGAGSTVQVQSRVRLFSRDTLGDL